MAPTSFLHPEASARHVLSLLLSLRQQMLLKQSLSVSQVLSPGIGGGSSNGCTAHTQTVMSSAVSLEEQAVLRNVQSSPLHAARHTEPTQKESSGQSAEREQLDVQKPSTAGAFSGRRQILSAQSFAKRHLLPNTQGSIEQ